MGTTWICMWFAADTPIGIHRSHTRMSCPPSLHIFRIAFTWAWRATCSSGGHAAKHGACFTGRTSTWVGLTGPRAVARYTSVVAVTIMCFSTVGLTRQNQQSAWGSMAIFTSRLLFPVSRSGLFRGRLRQIDILRPPHSSSSLSSQAACASSGVEKVTQPKPLHGRPSVPSSRASRMRRIVPTCFRAFSRRPSSMLGGSLARKTWSGMTAPSSGPSCAAPSTSSFAAAAPFAPSAAAAGAGGLTRKGLSVVFSGRCIRAICGMDAAGLSARPWTQVRCFPLLPTFPSAMHRQTCPRRSVWKGGR
mmetsp:Transcript_57700/g.162707  ORF Transcript_57700/g.162707 Transcript_57700/m.162707 type:complete len:304 (-) Transcript_57700:722-1633(-)